MLLYFHSLLLSWLLASQVLGSSLSSNLWHRDDIGVRYTVHPKDTTNTSQITETEGLLYTICGTDSIVTVKTNHMVNSWTIDVKNDSDILHAITALEGVSYITQQEGQEVPPSTTDHKKLVVRDMSYYEALAKNGTDTQKTEDFLKSQVEEGSTVFRSEHEGRLVWYSLRLSPEAKTVVENHEGIEVLWPQLKKRWNRA